MGANVPAFTTIMNPPRASAEHLADRINIPFPAVPGNPLTTVEIRGIVAYIVSLKSSD